MPIRRLRSTQADAPPARKRRIPPPSEAPPAAPMRVMNGGLRQLLGSVVKVLTVSDAPDYEQPWQTHGPQASTGSGAVIVTERGLRILTNAHVVMNQVFVEVRRAGSATKFVARVEGVVHECDLALLAVKDESFFDGAVPVELGELPHLGDRVTVCGYPVGGDRLSLTEGVVSRIEVGGYAHSQRPLLAVQIDAAVNAGNSGGPVFADGKLVGVAFQALDETQNIAYAIAPPIVRHFLRDIAGGKPRGFPSLGIGWQRLESAAHKKSLGLGTHEGGILVTKIAFGSSAWGVLQPRDVLLSIAGVAVHADGTSNLREGELVDHGHFVSLCYVGERVPIVVLRDGARTALEVELTTPRLLVVDDRYDVRPSYFVFGGLLFAPLTRDYLKSWGQDWWKTAPSDLMALYHSGYRTPDREDVVVLQKVLADGLNQGYHDFENAVVTAVDGVGLRGMQHLVDLVERADGKFVRFHLFGGEEVVLERARAVQRERVILDRYGVPADRSADLIGKRPRPASRSGKARAPAPKR